MSETDKMNGVITRLQSGEKDAFREIVETFQAKIRALIAFKGLQPTDVDDVAQDTFLHVYEHIGEFEAGTNFEGWIKTITHYKTTSHLEAVKREQKNKGNLLQVFLIENAHKTSEPEGDELMERLRKCMGRLDEKIRNLLEKRYSGVPLSRISEELGRSVDAIKMMLLRTRTQLRKCMEAPVHG